MSTEWKEMGGKIMQRPGGREIQGTGTAIAKPSKLEHVQGTAGRQSDWSRVSKVESSRK